MSHLVAALFFCVEIGTMGLCAFAAGRPALCGFIIKVMVLLFFPPMAMSAAVLKRATVSIGLCLALRSPGRALIARVVVDVDLASKVLPVVRVHTQIPCVVLVVFVIIRTPRSFEVE